MDDSAGRAPRILAYCPASAPGASSRTGSADYSYAFVLERFRPVLDSLGDVVEIHSEIHLREELVTGRDSRNVVLSFAPVQRTPTDCGVPTVPVFAWEFDTLPRWTENGATYDWAQILSRCQAAITLSEHTADVVRASTGTPVRAVPAPVFDRFHQLRTHPGSRAVSITGQVIDSRDLPGLDDLCETTWDDQPQVLEFGAEDLDTGRLVGFHRAEDWGCWSAASQVGIVLPFRINGRTRLTLDCVGVGPNAGRTVTVSAGRASAELVLPGAQAAGQVVLDVEQASSLISITGLLPTLSGTAHDHRRLGMGLTRLRIERQSSWRDALRRRPRPAQGPEHVAHSIPVDGVVYSSVLNPADGRKNWRTMVTAFCSAFRDDPSATLVLKMTHRSLAAFVGPLVSALNESAPFECRVIALHGYMTDAELAGLAAVSDFYVNASTGEGLCMPMMEFMSLGVPAVAPRHTAMAEYLDDGNSFAVDWSGYPTCWPQDPSRRWRTHQCRVHWDSLRAQYLASHSVAADDPHKHRAMREQSVETQRAFSGDKHVRDRLRAVLDDVLTSTS